MKTTLDRLRASLVVNPSDVAAAIGLAAELRGARQKRELRTAVRRAETVAPANGQVRELVFQTKLAQGGLLARVVANDLVRSLVVTPDALASYYSGAVMFRDYDRLQWSERFARRAAVLSPNDPRPPMLLWKLQENWGWGGRGMLDQHLIPGGHKENDARFFRTAEARFFPLRLDEIDDVDTVLQRDIFYGYLPDRPLIPADRSIIAMGSCFAQHIRQWLIKRGRLSDHVEIPEGLNNTFAIRQFIDWVEGRDDLVYSYGRTASGKLERWDLDKDRYAFRDAMARAGGFIVTVGVAEVWRDKATGGVFWRGVPADHFDPERHEHMLSTVEQNVENLEAVVAGIRRLAGDAAPVVITLSPVPLVATMRPNTSIFAADAVSKSTLRLAIETVTRSSTKGAYYWPSFEAFRWLGAHLERRLYDGERNARHPSPDMIRRIIDLFVDSYMEPQPQSAAPQRDAAVAPQPQ